jgi:hypothetical protein
LGFKVRVRYLIGKRGRTLLDYLGVFLADNHSSQSNS